MSKPAAPHVLYVAWGYPPSRGAGMYRSLATANAFAADGWHVTVLTATRDTFERLTGSDPQTEACIDPRIDVVRIPFEPARGETDLARWSRARVYSPLLWNYLHWLWSRAPFPEVGYGGWKQSLVTAAERIHRARPVDLVVGSANPNVDFAPGMHLHRRHGVPYVMDYRDTWHLDMYSGKTIGSRFSRSRRLERSLLSRSTEAWFVNEAIRNWHAEKHPQSGSKFHVVANGFDSQFLESMRAREPEPDEGLTFGFVGTVYGPMPLRETLDGWRLARSASPLIAASRLVFRGRLGHYTEPDPIAAALLHEYAEDGVEYRGPVSKTQVAESYSEIDVLTLILGRSKYITSGKVFEYAATGLPIVSAHHPETAASEILEGYPRHFAVDDTEPTSIASAFVKAGESAARGSLADRETARLWARKLSREAQLAPRISSLRHQVIKQAEEDR